MGPDPLVALTEDDDLGRQAADARRRGDGQKGLRRQVLEKLRPRKRLRKGIGGDGHIASLTSLLFKEKLFAPAQTMSGPAALAWRRIGERPIIMDDAVIARILHVLAVVVWIGGVSMVTTTVLPALRRGDFGPDRLKAFEAIERRFVWQARIAVLIVGITGFYMCWRYDLWDRFQDAGFWWMHAMLALFIVEPLILHRHLHRWASAQPKAAFAAVNRVHWILLALSAVTILGAVAGSHGWSIF
jgi:uncharacterized membrane protein